MYVTLRYFMRELLPLGAVDKPKLPVFLTSWVDKTSALSMYTTGHTRMWSVSHLKAGCWYIDCGKIHCPVEEEDVKKACEKADSKGAAVASDHGEEDEEEVEADINLLPEKEKKKAKDKAEKEATKAKDKAAKQPKKGGRASRSKTVAAPSPPILMTETSTASPSQNPCKRDSSFAQLSVSRLQQLASPFLVDSAGDGLHVHEFFFSGSLLSTDAHYVEQKAFPKEWMDMMAFLEKVCIFSCLLNAS
jgi:sRNA-binding protein